MAQFYQMWQMDADLVLLDITKLYVGYPISQGPWIIICVQKLVSSFVVKDLGVKKPNL